MAGGVKEDLYDESRSFIDLSSYISNRRKLELSLRGPLTSFFYVKLLLEPHCSRDTDPMGERVYVNTSLRLLCEPLRPLTESKSSRFLYILEWASLE
jgi:hypothetical protein